MATSGTVNGNDVSGPNRVVLAWQVASQSVAGNYTVINWQLYWFFSGSVTCRDLDNGVAVIDGATVYSVSDVHNFSGGHNHQGNYLVASGQRQINHNSDGTRSFGASAGMTGWQNQRSEGSASWALPTIPREPSAPGTPSFSNLQPTSVTISWSAPSNVGSGLTQRQLQVSTNSGFTALVVDSTTSWGTSANVPGLAKGTQYWVRVRAYSSVGPGPWSSSTTFSTPATVPGAPPQPTVIGITSTSASVSWSTPSDNGGQPIAHYQVQYARNSAFTSGVVTADDNASPYEMTGLAKGTQYWVRVRARNSVGWGDWSPSQSFTTLSTVPGAPPQPTIHDITSHSVSVSWQAPSDPGGSAITGYDIQYARDAAFTVDVTTKAVAASASPHTLNGLLPATAYWVRVRAKNAQGVGEWSPPATAATISRVRLPAGGQWRNTRTWIVSGGQWVPAVVRRESGDVWT